MALVSLNLKPSKKQLRHFGLAALCMCNVIGLLLFWMSKISSTGIIVFSLAGVVIFLLSRLCTALLKPIYLGLILITFPVGWLISHTAMALFYYGIITPIAVVFRILGRDPLRRKYDPQVDTYWIPHKHQRSSKDYFHQF